MKVRTRILLRKQQLLSASLLVALIGCDAARESIDTKREALTGFSFGVTYQGAYQNNWQPTLTYSWENATEFGDRFAEQNSYSWFFDLVGGKPYFEETGDAWAGGLETVHVLYSNTHGGVSNTDAFLDMWDQNQRAFSSAMRLGDESVGLALWAAYSCKLLQFADGLLPTRWGNAFRGGLYYIMGSQDLVYDGITLSDTGQQVAENLNDGDYLYHAWFDGIGDWWQDQDGAVVTVGRQQPECEARRDNMKWPNVMAYLRLRDSDVQWYCWRYIYDI